MTHAVLTGPIAGQVALADGTKVDVSPQVAIVDTPEQAAEVADLIAREYAANGHPDVDGDFEYVKDADVVVAHQARAGEPDMPNIGTTAANQALDGMANGTVKTMDFVTLNSAAPGSTGANESRRRRVRPPGLHVERGLGWDQDQQRVDDVHDQRHHPGDPLRHQAPPPPPAPTASAALSRPG
ncbi:hypothetical protein G5V59_27070 [Nocardioides sp. W3-2-3]|uniref:hypothetical protein n=1 Tax=Nocardioides convexus TaxID=2712224 RepID=UPI0024181476|nr:hypothetical protein [Nocardioides convexus]NHA02055.1 hypothetical protein [Nocardioides convexus]